MELIPQRELQAFIRRQTTLRRLRSQVRELEAEHKTAERSLIQRLNGGAGIRDGALTAEVEEKQRANRISEARVAEILGETTLQTLKAQLGETEFDQLQVFESLEN